MKKIIHVCLKTILVLLLISPILGTLGVFPAPTPDMYKTDEAYQFIFILMNAGYIMWIMSAVFLVSIVLIFKNKMAAAALLITPITVNIVGFHAFLDGGLLTSGAIMGNVLLLINLYFLYQNRNTYKALL